MKKIKNKYFQLVKIFYKKIINASEKSTIITFKNKYSIQTKKRVLYEKIRTRLVASHNSLNLKDYAIDHIDM